MNGVAPGDILPAREAISAIDQVDLSPPIEVPAVPAEAQWENISPEERQWLRDEIVRLKKERNAFILAPFASLPLDSPRGPEVLEGRESSFPGSAPQKILSM